MNDASPRLAEGQTGAASLLSSEEGNLRLAQLAQYAVELNAWVTEEGLRGATAGELFDGYCRRLSAMDVVIMRAYVSTQTLHPQWTGYGYTWRRELKSVREQQFARGPISQLRQAGRVVRQAGRLVRSRDTVLQHHHQHGGD
jgi:hypothetical protein